MPQPDDVTAVGEQLIDTYRQAEQQLLDRLAAVINDPSRWREAARLRDLLAGVDAILDELERASLDWANASLPGVYEAGAQAAASTLGSSFAWSTPHTEAMQALATATWDDILQATTFVRADTKATLRRLVRDGTLRSLTGQVTPDASARDLAKQLVDEQGLLTVRYSNGARHSVADWADTAIRTRTAATYNEGGFVQCDEDGIEYVEGFDGASCGARSHDDPDKVNGTIRTLAFAREHTLAHPRCARSWGPRPDITSNAEATANSLPADERAKAAAEEDARAAKQPVKFAARPAGQARRPTRPTRQRTRPARPKRPTAPPPARRGPAPGTRTPASVLEVPAKGKLAPSIQQAAEDLGKLHGVADDGYPATEVVLGSNKGGGKGGHFSPNYFAKGRWRPEIRVNDRGDDAQLMSFLHEFGHRLDSIGPKAGFRSAAAHMNPDDPLSGAMLNFLKAARDTPTIKNADYLVPKAYRKHLPYFRDPREIWARAYSQWSANELGGPYRDALEAMRGSTDWFQWSDAEFEALAPLVEDVLRTQGLMV